MARFPWADNGMGGKSVAVTSDKPGSLANFARLSLNGDGYILTISYWSLQTGDSGTWDEWVFYAHSLVHAVTKANAYLRRNGYTPA